VNIFLLTCLTPAPLPNCGLVVRQSPQPGLHHRGTAGAVGMELLQTCSAGGARHRTWIRCGCGALFWVLIALMAVCGYPSWPVGRRKEQSWGLPGPDSCGFCCLLVPSHWAINPSQKWVSHHPGILCWMEVSFWSTWAASLLGKHVAGCPQLLLKMVSLRFGHDRSVCVYVYIYNVLYYIYNVLYYI